MQENQLIDMILVNHNIINKVLPQIKIMCDALASKISQFKVGEIIDLPLGASPRNLTIGKVTRITASRPGSGKLDIIHYKPLRKDGTESVVPEQYCVSSYLAQINNREQSRSIDWPCDWEDLYIIDPEWWERDWPVS